eukprot:COSAG04_NODE_1823_length_5490_cov_4.159866_1_plen_68_part_10
MADPLTEPFRRFSLAWEAARGAGEDDDGLQLLDEPLPQMCAFPGSGSRLWLPAAPAWSRRRAARAAAP